MNKFLDKNGVTYLYNIIKKSFEPTVSDQLVDVECLSTHFYKDSSGVKAITRWDPLTQSPELLYPTNCICVQSNGWTCGLNGNSNYRFNSGTDFAYVNEVNDCYFKGYEDNKSNVYAVYFNTKIKLTNASYMFEHCPYLKYVKFPGHDGAITNANSMFRGCSIIDYIDLTMLNFSNCSFDATFADCGAHTIKLRGSASVCGGMFYNTLNLKNISIELDCSNCTNFGRMFYNNTSLESLDLSKCNNINKSNWYGIFEGCTSLKTLTLPNSDRWLDAQTVAFNQCYELTDLQFDRFGQSNGTWDLSHCSKLNEKSLRSIFSINRSGWNELVVNVHPDTMSLINELGLYAEISDKNYTITCNASI